MPDASEKPMGIAIIVCDKVITEAGSNNKTIVSTFNCVSAKAFPAIHPRMAVFASLTNATGEKEIELVLKKENEEMFKMGGRGKFPTPTHVVEAIFNIQNCIFPEPGEYTFEIYADGEYVFDRRFHVVTVE